MKIHSAEWLATAADPGGFPGSDLPEVAFLGRSNVGKSSLLNALVQRKKLARTSSSPGKTRLIHFFHVVRPGVKLNLVDLPGYGYAKVSKSERMKWRGLVEAYLENRPVLRAAVLLQDLRRDLTEDETLLIDWLQEREIPVVLAITKIDKLKPMRRAERLRELRKQIALPKDCIIATSAEKKTGMDELWKAVDLRVGFGQGGGDSSTGEPSPGEPSTGG
jgi:GTP-binding protein